ncbi:uncharacterized protein [Elaeis guineensis]|uniref:uncharacterized protein n=1 Tax=Elaeis guineensis var. tenera TaxID=51953 RepID=UPI003C6D8730
MGSYRSIPQVDDLDLSALTINEVNLSEVPDDEKLAEELQLQEVLMSSMMSIETVTKPSCDVCYKANEVDADDRKMKQPIEHPQSVTEIGQSSRAPPVVEEFDCSICMESKPLFESFNMRSCSHKFCKSCLSQYVAASIQENVTSIRCPGLQCMDGVLELELCQPILSKDVFDQWSDMLCESMIKTKFYCPYGECSFLMEGDEGGGEVVTKSECPSCHRLFCARCRVPWHEGIGCEEFQQLGEGERGREDLMLRELATRLQWQRCPKCKIYVEKTEGCRFMKCRCGHCFCYVCSSSMAPDEHNCYKCMR